MNLRAVVCIFICTILTHEILPVTIQVDTLTMQTGTTKSSGSTKITFFGDRHILSSSEQEQITSVIDFLQQRKNNSFYHILVEQGVAVFKNKWGTSDYRILYSLDTHIQAAKPLMTHVVLDNVEIRCFAGEARDILNNYKYYEPYTQYQTDNGEKILGTITFQDVFDEFDILKQSLDPYYVNQKNQMISDIYAHYMGMAQEYCEQLKRKIVRKNDIVFDYAKREYRQREAQEMKASQFAQDLAKDIELTFNHLFDLNLLKNILMSSSQNILVFAGRDHTGVVMSMLARLNAIKIYQAINFVMQEKIEDGRKTEQLTLQPITGLQITQALSAQPQTTSYAPTICYLTLAAATLYYLMYVVLPMYGYA
jgi:hypothetical protein